MGNKYLNKESILSCPDLTTQAVDVPEWGGQVLIQSMTAAQRESFENSLSGENKFEGLRAKLVIASVVNESGVCVFTQDDAAALMAKSAAAIDRIALAVNKLNGFGDQAVEEAEGN